MAKSVLTNCLIALGGYNLRCSMNQVAVDYQADAPECTTFCNDTHVYAEGGLKTAAISGAGFFEAEEPDLQLYTRIGAAGVPITVCKSITPGDVAYFQAAMAMQYNPNAPIGQVLGFSLATAAQDKLYRGTLMEYQSGITGNGTGTGRQLGAVSADQSIVCCLHVTKADGSTPSLTVIVESDDNAGFTSATTRLTMAAAADLTAEIKLAAGAITDDYWRLRWTTSGSSLDFDFIGSLAIQS